MYFQFARTFRSLRSLALACFFGATTLLFCYQAVIAKTITRSVRAGGTVGIIALTITRDDICWSFASTGVPEPAPKLGKLFTKTGPGNSPMCKNVLASYVYYKAGKKRGTDRFKLYFYVDEDSWDYDVVIRVR